MTSKVEICNQAVSEVSADLISSIDNPQSDVERLCKLHYDNIRKALLNTGHFAFAMNRAVYDTPLAQKPAWGWEYAYLIPSNVLKVYEVRRPDSYIRQRDTRDTAIDFSIMGNQIHVSENPIYVTEVVDEKDTSKFSDLFIQAFKYRLAATLAMPVAENRSLRNDLWQLYNETMDDAVDYNREAIEKGRQQTSSTITARYRTQSGTRGTE